MEAILTIFDKVGKQWKKKKKPERWEQSLRDGVEPRAKEQSYCFELDILKYSRYSLDTEY